MPNLYDTDLELENNAEFAGDTLSPQPAYPYINGEVARFMATSNSDEAFMAEHELNMNGTTYLNNLDDSLLDVDFDIDEKTEELIEFEQQKDQCKAAFVEKQEIDFGGSYGECIVYDWEEIDPKIPRNYTQVTE